MPRLVTQTVTDQPRILLISSLSSFSQELKSIFEKHNFSVHLHSNEQPLAENIKSASWYKIIILQGFSGDKIDVSIYIDNITPLSVLPGFVYLIQPLVQRYLSSNTNYQNFDQAEADRRQFRAWCQAHFKKLSIVLGQDVIWSETTDWWPFQWLIQLLPSRKLLSPSVDTYPVSLKKFIHHLQTILLKPSTPSFQVLRGHAQPAKVLVEEIQRLYAHYHDLSLDIKFISLQTESDSLFEGYQIRELAKETVPELLATSISLLPRLKQNVVAELAKVDLAVPTLTAAKVKKDSIPPPPLVFKQEVVTKSAKQKPRSLNREVKKASSGQPPTVVSTATLKKKNNSSAILEKKLQSLFSNYRVDTKIGKFQELAAVTRKITTKNKKRKALFLGGLGVVGAGLGILILALYFWFSQVALNRHFFNSMAKPEEIVNNKGFAKYAWQVATQINTYSLVLPDPFFDNANSLLVVSSELLEVSAELEKIKQGQVNQALYMLGDVAQPDSETPLAVQSVYEKSSRLQSRLEAYLDDDLSAEERQNLLSYIKYLEGKRAGLVSYQQLFPLMPDLFGQNEKRTYAVVFQNDQELRATGGFVQAVAIVTFDRGSIIDYQVFSSYQLDEKLTGSVTPPADLKLILGEERFYLRDSNWSPDFVTTAQTITWFIDRQLNKKIDGVIALTLPVIEDILKAAGPLDLAKYNELVTDRNLQERIEFHSEVTLVETDQSSDYAVVLFEQLIKKITSVTDTQVFNLFSVLASHASRKNLLIFLTNPDEQATISLLGWSGEIIVPNCPAQFSTGGCEVDSLGVFDSNVGINKANYHTKRYETHQIVLSPTVANHKHSVTFTNNSQSNSWPKGPYKSYLRFVVPANVKVKSVKINDKFLTADDLITSTIGDQAVVGVLSNTPIQQSTTIVFEYSTPLNLEDKSSYTFFYQKQPGTKQVLSSVELDYSSDLEPVLIAPQADVSGNTISFTEIPDEHLFLGVKFSK